VPTFSRFTACKGIALLSCIQHTCLFLDKYRIMMCSLRNEQTKNNSFIGDALLCEIRFIIPNCLQNYVFSKLWILRIIWGLYCLFYWLPVSSISIHADAVFGCMFGALRRSYLPDSLPTNKQNYPCSLFTQKKRNSYFKINCNSIFVFIFFLFSLLIPGLISYEFQFASQSSLLFHSHRYIWLLKAQKANTANWNLKFVYHLWPIRRLPFLYNK
jgi:hypothetical protein